MAMKFGEVELTRVVDECFRPAVRRTGFELRLVTDQQPAGLIDDQMRAAVLAARFVISDLTHGSPGAYWEAGFGEGLGLPVIYTCQKRAWQKTQTHFDTNHLVTITWDIADLKKAEDALAATIRATLRSEAKRSKLIIDLSPTPPVRCPARVAHGCSKRRLVRVAYVSGCVELGRRENGGGRLTRWELPPSSSFLFFFGTKWDQVPLPCRRRCLILLGCAVVPPWQ